MKKLLAGVFTLLMSTSCIFFIWDRMPSGEHGYWYLKNETDITLKVSHSWMLAEYEIVDSGDSICIYPIYPSAYFATHPKFDSFCKLDSIYVHDENGKELCRWIQGDIQEGQRNIYEEEYWTYYRDSLDYIWVFDVTSEDFISFPSVTPQASKM